MINKEKSPTLAEGTPYSELTGQHVSTVEPVWASVHWSDTEKVFRPIFSGSCVNVA